jgi:hypothetical protein
VTPVRAQAEEIAAEPNVRRALREKCETHAVCAHHRNTWHVRVCVDTGRVLL